MRRIRILEHGFGLRSKAQKARALADQRRIDGTRTRFGDSVLKKFSNLMQSIIEPARLNGKNFNKSHYTREDIIRERKRLGRK